MKRNKILVFFSISLLCLGLVACNGRAGGEDQAKKSQEDKRVEETIPDSVDQALRDMEEREIGPGYTREEMDFFDETTLHIGYRKDLGDGWLDAYDFYDVFFDTENLKL